MMSTLEGGMPIVETGGARLGIGFVGGLVAAAVFGGALGWGRGGYGRDGYGYGAGCGGYGYGPGCGYNYGCDNGLNKVVAEMALINQDREDQQQWKAISKLSERVAVADTRAMDNYMFDKERACLTNQLTKCEIREATCDFLPARKMIRPEDMGSPYHGGQNFLVSTHRNNFGPFTPFNHCGPKCDNNWDNNCF